MCFVSLGLILRVKRFYEGVPMFSICLNVLLLVCEAIELLSW